MSRFLCWLGIHKDVPDNTGWTMCYRCDRQKRGMCTFVTVGGMHCAKQATHDGPHSFTNAEWHRTR